MLRYYNYEVVFQEVPGEVTLAVNLTGCPNACPSCHSPHLQLEVGGAFCRCLLDELLERYGAGITCFCFMGGDNDPSEVVELALQVRARGLKTAWYSGKSKLPEGCSVSCFDYIKLGPYVERLGGLGTAKTNQRFYRVVEGKMVDETRLFG